MKTLLRELPTLNAPIAGETLMLYLATSKEAISSVLVADRGQVQMPVYFVSKALSGSEVNYPPIEKQVYALVLYKLEVSGEVEALAKGTTIGHDESQIWELYTDGAYGPECTGAELVLTGPDGEEHTYALRFTFAATNNESEYEALLSEMRIVQQLEINHLDAYVDS
ncbi:uncharacterized protein [Rutidosis leptorrhynchoides]|uniref:uncharacterized protein n=1 Tax=Rutidosis leptorrhynchoides TaxID=125765 RepID=UPI003A9A57EC